MSTQVVLVKVDSPSGSRYFSDSRYVNTVDAITAEPRLQNEVTFSRRASCVFWGGGRASQGVGAIELVNNDGGLDGFIAENLRGSVVTVYLGTDGQLLSSMTKCARGIIESVQTIGEKILCLVLADAATELDKPVLTATYTTGSLTGTLIPVTLGYCLSIPALHTGAPSLQFSIHDAGAGGSGTTNRNPAYDSGVTLTAGTQWTVLDGGEQHGFTLLQATAGVITCDATGPASNFNVFSARQLYYITEFLLVTRNGWSSSRVDFAGITTLQTELGTTWIGRWISGPSTYAEVLTEMMDSIAGWWYINVDGVVKFDRLRMPSGSPVVELDVNNIEGDIDLEFDKAPGLSDAVLGLRNWYVHDPSQLATSVRDTATGVSMRKQYRSRSQFAVHDVYASARSAAPTVRPNLASDATQTPTQEPESGMPTLLMNAVHVSTEATRRAALYDGSRWFYGVTALLDAVSAATLERGAIVRLTSDRYSLDAGRLCCVVGVDGSVGKGRVRLLLWADGPETV